MLVVGDGVVGKEDGLIVGAEEEGSEGAFGVVGCCVDLDAETSLEG